MRYIPLKQACWHRENPFKTAHLAGFSRRNGQGRYPWALALQAGLFWLLGQGLVRGSVNVSTLPSSATNPAALAHSAASRISGPVHLNLRLISASV